MSSNYLQTWIEREEEQTERTNNPQKGRVPSFITRNDGVASKDGDVVEFECAKNPKNDKLFAHRIRKKEKHSQSVNLNQSKKRKISDSMDPPSKRQKLNAKDEESDTVGSVGREQQNETKERHKGIVKLFLNQKKYGFIKWNGEDLLFHQDGIKKVDGSQPLICGGDYVEFEIGVGSNGRNRAIDVILDPDRTISRIRGKCVRWRGEKRSGFIQRDDDGSDVFVHLDQIMDHKKLQPKERVEFEVAADPRNGKLRAVRVSRRKKAADTQSEDQMSETSDSDSEPKIDANSENADSEDSKQSKKRKLNAKDEESDTSENVGRERQDQIKERHKGIVKFFRRKKEFGYIKWNGGENLYFHANASRKENEKVRFHSGDAVEFEIGTGNKGINDKVAVNVVLHSDRTITRIRGKCIEWRREKGFGTIKRDDDGSYVSVHLPDITDHKELHVTERVEFKVVRRSKSGKQFAVRVSRIKKSADIQPEDQVSDETSDSDTDTESDANSDNADSEHSKPSNKRKISDQSDRATKKRKLNDSNDTTENESVRTKRRHKGVVKLFSKSKRYGSIKWGQRKELWFHANDSQKENERVTFYPHDAVEFEIGAHRGKEAAINVVLDPDHETPKVRGQCMRWNEEKGFGFIKRDDDGADVFVHCDCLIDESTLRVGDRAEFEVITDYKTGKSRAVRVRKIEEENGESADSVNKMNINAKDEASDSSEITTKERHKGEIGLFLSNKGYGFIKWDGGEDLWFHIDDSRKENERVTFYDGDAVEFEIGTGNKGINDKVAVNVVLDSDRTITRIRGKCTSWNKEKGFGFIQRDDDGSDVFVHLYQVMDHKELQSKERVEFEVVRNPKNGKLLAVRVSRRKKAADTQSEDQMSETSDSDTDPQIDANSESADSEGSTPSVEGKSDRTKQRYKGEIARFLKEKGYGFIRWDGGEDLWFLVNDSSEEVFEKGDAVCFEMGFGKKGINDKMAKNIVLDPDNGSQSVGWKMFKSHSVKKEMKDLTTNPYL